jgi:hypothetical protein
VRPSALTRITPSPGTVAAEIVSFVAAALAGFFADVVLVAAGVLALDELDELLPQPATATASTGSIKTADIFFTKSSFGRRRQRPRSDRGDIGHDCRSPDSRPNGAGSDWPEVKGS